MSDPRGVEAVVFDCWQTLFTNEGATPVDELADRLGVPRDERLVEAYERAFALEPHDDYRAPVRRVAEAVGADHSPEAVDETAARLAEIDERIVAYDDTFALLDDLDDVRLGLLTNTGNLSLRALRERQPVDAHFDAVVASYEEGALKPDPAMFDAVLDAIDVDAAATAMVGDSLDADVRAARRHGFRRAVLVDRHGYHPEWSPRVRRLGNVPGRLRT